jgi:pimeloyl-ACP methyl ester carboxylesterase
VWWLLWVALALVGAAVLGVVLALAGLYFHLVVNFLHYLVRIFKEKPLFIIPKGQPVKDAEEVRFPNADGQTLRGIYWPTNRPARLGVILFGLEFGSNRWACVPYCRFLRDAGFDIFAFESRGQGDSDPEPGYEPLQWVTDHEVKDVYAAINYLKGRPNADPRGAGFFGISKGAGAGLLAAARSPYLRCFVTDGVFATHSTMVPYMRKWIAIYSKRIWVQHVLPDWFYGLIARAGLRSIRRENGCRFPHLEKALPKLAPRPLLMIHGGADTYIKPEMARTLYRLARQPKELWVVEGAKHNQAFHDDTEAYQRRVLDFFRHHLATDLALGDGAAAPAVPAGPFSANGTTPSPAPADPQVAG